MAKQMTMDELLETYKDIPEMNSFSVDMPQANLPIRIYEGEFILKNDKDEGTIDGNITFDWFPISGAHFSGKLKSNTPKLLKKIYHLDDFMVIIDDLKFGQAFITNVSSSSHISDIKIKGTLSQQAIRDDQSIPVNKILFSIPNLREFHGLPVKNISDKSISFSRGRLRFDDDDYTITIDKAKDYKDRKNSLKEKGGYIVLYAGELTCKNGTLTHKNTKDVFNCLNTFLSFLNGRRTSALFIQGIYNNEVLWRDYSSYSVAPYKNVLSWMPDNSINGLNLLWKNFRSFWEDPDDKNFLISLIHWYVEANSHAGLLEGSIILAQTALELIYNWWIIEKKGMLLGKDTKSISASNKIRLLLSQSNIDFKAPRGFTNLQEFIDSTENVLDAPDAIVYIRNAIVHSQVEKRKKLSEINSNTIYEALELFIWYIEISLLRILKFNAKYFNRCLIEDNASKAEMDVPWKGKEN
jgi:hypothetical protein